MIHRKADGVQINIVGGTTPPSGEGMHRGGGPQKLAQALGVSTQDLQQARRAGTTLADFAKTTGISQDDLLKAVKSTISDRAQGSGAPALSDDQLTKMATDMINRVPGQGGPGGHGGGAAGAGAPTGTMPSREMMEALKGAGRDNDGDGDDGGGGGAKAIVDQMQQLQRQAGQQSTAMALNVLA
ncbi:MAG: hypothetical protein U0Y82_09690 [Thermoleophilia bacterium]